MKYLENVCTEVERNKKIYHPISPEIVMTSSFYFQNFQEYVEACKNEAQSYVYTRGNNPTTELLEKKLATLEGGQRCKVFASGMGAISASLFTLLSSGDHVLLLNTVYGTAKSTIQYMEKYGVTYDVLNSTDLKDIERALKDNTKMIYFESPSSQKFELVDLGEVSKIAKERGIYTVIDNTWASPLFQNPLKYGIDVVIHSCSKYISGHSDAVAGAVISSDEIISDIEDHGFMYLGSTCSPINTFLLLRGLRTLPVRMNKFNDSIKKILDVLKEDDRIEKIYHPYVGDDYQKELANKYLSGYGSLFAIDLKDPDLDKLARFVETLKIFTLGVSWGGFESLVLPVFKGDNQQSIIDRGLSLTHVRMYVGLENPDSLIEDVKNALDSVYGG